MQEDAVKSIALERAGILSQLIYPSSIAAVSQQITCSESSLYVWQTNFFLAGMPVGKPNSYAQEREALKELTFSTCCWPSS